VRGIGIFVGSIMLAGCTATGPVAVTPELARSGRGASEQTLREGRALFVSRCIECHSLPDPHRYPRERWPLLIDKMAGRASLSQVERDAILTYVQAARELRP